MFDDEPFDRLASPRVDLRDLCANDGDAVGLSVEFRSNALRIATPSSLLTPRLRASTPKGPTPELGESFAFALPGAGVFGDCGTLSDESTTASTSSASGTDTFSSLSRLCGRSMLGGTYGSFRSGNAEPFDAGIVNPPPESTIPTDSASEPSMEPDDAPDVAL
jgi:hypothetical protein